MLIRIARFKMLQVKQVYRSQFFAATTYRGDNLRWRQLTVVTTYRGDNLPWRRLTVPTTYRGNNLPWRQLTVATTYRGDKLQWRHISGRLVANQAFVYCRKYY